MSFTAVKPANKVKYASLLVAPITEVAQTFPRYLVQAGKAAIMTSKIPFIPPYTAKALLEFPQYFIEKGKWAELRSKILWARK